MQVRKAKPEEAETLCALLCSSITDLCEADHKNDPQILARWLANKTPQTIAQWIGAPLGLWVVELHDAILGVGSYTTKGEITLNYVLPVARFKGASKTLLSALEEEMREIGCVRSFLTSTATARRFYEGRGYSVEEEISDALSPTAYLMSKNL